MTNLVYERLGTGIGSIQNRTGVLFFMCINCIVNGINAVVNLFPDERGVFLREQSSGMYSVLSYFSAKYTAEIPRFIIVPSILTLVCYFILGLNLNSWDKLAMFWLITVTLYANSSAMGLFIGAIFEDKVVAVAMTPAFFVPTILFSGYIVH